MSTDFSGKEEDWLGGVLSSVPTLCAFFVGGSSLSVPGSALFQVWQHGFDFLALGQLSGEVPSVSLLLLSRTVIPESPGLLLPSTSCSCFLSHLEWRQLGPRCILTPVGAAEGKTHRRDVIPSENAKEQMGAN